MHSGSEAEWENERIRGSSGTNETEQPRKRDSGVQMNRQNSVASEQMLTTVSSIRSVDKEKMILLSDYSILQGDCHFVEKFCDFEPQRINNDQSQRANKGRERIERQFTTHQSNSTKQDSCRTRNQDCLAPAPSNISIEVASIRVREHQHLERTPSWVVSWTAAGIVRRSEKMKKFSRDAAVEVWKRDRDAHMNRKNIPESEQMITTEGQIISSCKGRMILLFNSSNLSWRLTFSGGILLFWAMNQKRSESTFEYRGKARNRDRFNELIFTGTRIIPFQASGFIFFLSPISIRMSSLSVSLISWISNSGWIETFLTTAQDFFRVGECNQDFVAPALCHIHLWAAGLVTPFVAPALCHMPIEVVSVRVREHPHEERTPSGVVYWTDR